MDLPKVVCDVLRGKQVVPVQAIGEIIIGQVGSAKKSATGCVIYAPSSP
jgi:hypothetical protein